MSETPSSEPSRDNSDLDQAERDRLLTALDFEISSREREDSRLGISYWSLVVSLFVALWFAIEHGLDPAVTFEWSRVLLVFLGARAVLGRAYEFFHGRTINDGHAFSGDGKSRFHTIDRIILVAGGSITALYVQTAEEIVVLAAATFLVVKGYVVLGAVTIAISLLALALFALVLIGNRVRVPFLRVDDVRARPQNKLTKALFPFVRVGVYVLVLLPFIFIIRDWTLITPDEWKHGLMVASIVVLMRLIAVRSPASADLRPLERIRTRLAFGWCNAATAKNEIDDILLGITPERYVEAKVSSIREFVYKQAGATTHAAECMREVLSLKKTFDGEADKENFVKRHEKQILGAMRIVGHVVRQIPKDDAPLSSLFKSLEARCKIVTTIQDVPESRIAELKRPIGEAFAARTNAITEICDIRKEFENAYEVMLASLQKKPGAPISGWREFRRLISAAD